MILPNDVARCRGVEQRGWPVPMCWDCLRRLAWLDDREREVDRVVMIDPPERVSNCTMHILAEDSE